MGRLRATGAILAALLSVAGCDSEIPVDPVPRPPGRPADVTMAADAPLPPPTQRPAPASTELAEFYQRVQDSLVQRGLLRRDGGGPDTPYDARRLADTFLRVALFEEYTAAAGVLVQRETASRLHRWQSPVRIEPRFGPSVPAAQVARDRAAIAGYAGRLARATGHPVAPARANGNFVVYVVDEAERRALGPELRKLVPGLSNEAVNSIVNLPRSSYCVVLAIDAGDNGTYTRAVAIVRAEHPDLLRLSCFHEEIAQGLGLANDWPGARPSIFNDDEEFALLTTMDEALLRILYDPRLTPGVDASEAAPLVREIAASLAPGES